MDIIFPMLFKLFKYIAAFIIFQPAKVRGFYGVSTPLIQNNRAKMTEKTQKNAKIL